MKIHSVLIKYAVRTHGRPYLMLFKTSRKSYSLFSETALTTFMEIHPMLIKCAVIAHWKQHFQLFEREQWQHTQIHPLLNQYAATKKGKLNPLLFERDQSKHMENHIIVTRKTTIRKLWPFYYELCNMLMFWRRPNLQGLEFLKMVTFGSDFLV